MARRRGAPVDPLDIVRSACLALPEVVERLSHGTPTFFVKGKRSFVTVWPDGHHDDVFPHLWCAAPAGAQAEATAAEPERFFVPPYVGGRGWLGVRLDLDVDAGELAALCLDAYRAVAPVTLLRRLPS